MKKLFASLLAVCSILTCLAACDTITAPCEHIVSEYEYDEYQHWRIVTCSWQRCDVNPKREEHVNTDTDKYCDVCGYAMITEHEHTYEWIGNPETHFKQYTCGCDSPDIAGLHSYNNGNGVCDVCGYAMITDHEHTYEWIGNPETHFKQYTCGCDSPDIAGLHSDYDGDGACDVCGYVLPTICPSDAEFLKELEPWLGELTADNVAEIKTTQEYVGVAPGRFKNIQRTTDKSVIAQVISAYKSVALTQVSREEAYISGGGAFTIEFIRNDGTVEKLYFNNGNYRYDKPELSALCFFALDHTPTLTSYGNVKGSFGFITYVDTATVYEHDAELCALDAIGELEFVNYQGSDYNAHSAYTHTIETEFGTLYVFSERVFCFEEQCYELTSGSFYDMFDRALSPDYSVTMNDEAWLWEDLKPTYKAGDVVSVKIGMALDVGYLFLVNGEEIATCNDVDGLYWEFTFTMPNCDVVIDFKTYDGFLPDYNYAVLIESYFMQNLDAESVMVKNYYGEFESDAIVAMLEVGGYGYDDALGEETINGVVIRYNNGNRITVLYEGNFYSLTQAYENGYLTKEDIAEIAERQREFYPYLY